MGRKKHSLSSIIHNVSTDSFEKFNWRHKISNLVEYNNYLVNNPFYNSDHFSVDLSIDFATIIIAPYHHSLNDTIYKLYLLGISRYVLKNGYGNCVISHNNAHYTVFFQIITVNNFFKCCLLKIHDPDLQILHHVHNLFSGAYLISQVEFTADCLAKEHDALLFLMNHLMLLKWPGALLRLNYATIYGNDIRNNKFKGVRLYEKQLKANLVVRLEIVYKRSYFRKNKINSLLQLNNLSADSVFSYVTFRMLKTKTIINKFKHKRKGGAWLENC